MAKAASARETGAISAETRRWLAALPRHPAFQASDGGLPVSAEALEAELGLLLQAAGGGTVADLLLGALRTLPLDGGTAAGQAAPDVFAATLALLLGAVQPEPETVDAVLQGLASADSGLDRRGGEGLGLRFLALATELGLVVRIGGPVALLARLLHDLGTLAGRGAGALLFALEAAEGEEERIRGLLNDPAFAMRAHYLVPRRSLTAGDAGTVRKEFARDDRLAARARGTLGKAREAVAGLRADIALLQAMERALQAEAAAVLAGPR